MQRRGEFLNLPTEFMLGDHILYSHDFSDWECVDITKRVLTLWSLLERRPPVVSPLTSYVFVFFFSQASPFIHVPVTLSSLKVKTVHCPQLLTKSFPVTINNKGVSSFVVGIENNQLIAENVSKDGYKQSSNGDLLKF